MQAAFEDIEVLEDTPVGSKILGIELNDPDLTGMALSISCIPSSQVKRCTG